MFWRRLFTWHVGSKLQAKEVHDPELLFLQMQFQILGGKEHDEIFWRNEYEINRFISLNERNQTEQFPIILFIFSFCNLLVLIRPINLEKVINHTGLNLLNLCIHCVENIFERKEITRISKTRRSRFFNFRHFLNLSVHWFWKVLEKFKHVQIDITRP